LIAVASQTDGAPAAWHASASLGYPLYSAPYESVTFDYAPVVGLVLAHRGTGAIQPRFAAQVGGTAAGKSTYVWLGTIPDYSLQVGWASFGAEIVSKSHVAALAVSPGLAIVRWTQGPYYDGFLLFTPARTWTSVVPLIAVDGTVHVPLVAGLDLEPGLSWIFSTPIVIDSLNERRIHQVQAHIGLGF
jgi:hypothetical protein